MAITEQQKQTTARHDLGGDALEALLAIASAGLVPTTLAITTVSVTAASATIQALLTAASGAIHASVKKITIKPAGTVSIALGVAAVAGTNDLTANVYYPLAALAATDLRFVASGATNMLVVQEG